DGAADRRGPCRDLDQSERHASLRDRGARADQSTRAWTDLLRELVRGLSGLGQFLLHLLSLRGDIGGSRAVLPQQRAGREDHGGAAIERRRETRCDLSRPERNGSEGSAARAAVPRAPVRAAQTGAARRTDVARAAAGAVLRRVAGRGVRAKGKR